MKSRAAVVMCDIASVALLTLAPLPAWAGAGALQPPAPDSPEAGEAQRLTAESNRLFEAGQYAAATPLAERAQQLREQMLGPEHPDALAFIDNLGQLYVFQGRHAEAERLYRQALERSDRRLGPDHLISLRLASGLGENYEEEGRYAEAEPLLRRGAEGSERVLGRDNPFTQVAFQSLGKLYLAQGRNSEAEPILRRTMADAERLFGLFDPNTVLAVNNLAALYFFGDRLDEAAVLMEQALTISAQTRGLGHPDSLLALMNLAALRIKQGRPELARTQLELVVATSEREHGNDHATIVVPLNHLGGLHLEQGRPEQVEPLLRRALAIALRTGGPGHPNSLLTIENLLTLWARQGRPSGDSLEVARRFLATIRERRLQGGADVQARAQRDRETLSAGKQFALFADVGWSAIAAAPGQREAVRGEAFGALQDAVAGPSDRTILEQAAQRYAGGRNAALATLIQERQRLQEQWIQFDARLAQAFGDEPGGAGEGAAALRRELERVQARIAAIDARLRAEAPDYFALIEPTPLDAVAAQALLAQDEAILLVVPSRFGTHVMAVTREGIAWHRSDWNEHRIGEAVRRLRWDAGARVTASDEEVARLRAGRAEEEAPAFDRVTAHQLYRQVVTPALASLAGKAKLFIVAGGPLAGLPLSLLVSAPPPAGADDDPASLRATRWFADDFQLAHIPSIRSLAVLRGRRGAGGGDRFIGIGNPRLAAAREQRGYRRTRGAGSASRLFVRGRTRNGAPADMRELRAMPSLPGTAVELRQVREALRAPTGSVLEAERATEPEVRGVDFTNARLVLFSTHGLTSEEAIGAGEPGLVLTPPPERADVDEYLATNPANDGYLAASEVTTLRMDADWVVLSACNTATGDDDANLSALARAFFYAGARNLLASHWPVSDDVAPLLITRTVAPGQSGLARGAALQQAMRSIRDDPAHPEWAHPFYWAPFALIGDGGS